MAYENKAEIMRNVDATMSKLVARNTVEYTRPNGERVIRLHHTDVVTTSADGSTITLNSGGWKTVTTKDRLNTFAKGVTVYSNKGVWYVRNGKEEVAFYDGMQITNGCLPPDKPSIVKDQTKLARQINAFCRAIRKLDVLPTPSNGDCWFCMLNDKELNDNSHLLSHIEENYIHGTLLVKAMRHCGCRDEPIYFHYQMKLNDTFARAVRRYLRDRFGLPR